MNAPSLNSWSKPLFARGLLVASLLVALAAATGPGQAVAQEKLKIGFGGALLGNLATYGLSNFYGLEYAVLDINKKGGIRGQQVEIVSEDDSCVPAKATEAAEKLLSSKVRFVLGHSCSGATRAALKVYGDKALVVSSSATEFSLTEDGKSPYFFRTTPRDDIQVKLQLALIKKNNYKKIAIVHDNGDYGQSLAAMTKKMIDEDLSGELKAVVYEGVVSGQLSFEPVIAKVVDAEAEALVWCGYYNDAAKLAAQLLQNNVKITLIGPDGLNDKRYVNIAQKAAEGTFCTGQIDYSQSAAARVALADHRRRYYSREIGSFFFYSAGAAQALFAALEKVGPEADFPTIKRRLTEDTVETVMGPIRFDSKGDVIGAGFKIFVIDHGRFVEVNL
ncbi:MAG: branched-chain amino acid ABC transporter substrate-binding protein [Deltaproteobacteria bacterium]|jgi:branched-chain amino acid transport system substrate-binding protein|nr:branched-chain amino acid ABC transporter substrate-binding protein [Deltaproteobacteria bacterium]